MPKVPVDWRALEQRMETLRAALEQTWEPTPAQVKHILKTRAQVLARAPQSMAVDDTTIEVVEFNLAYERYAIESRWVREVCPLNNLTSLPCTPGFVLGIVNLRGEILSVIDIKKFFDLPEKGLTNLNQVIVLQSGAMTFGILADAIIDARRIKVADIQPPPPTFTGIRAHYLRGVTPQCTVILDAEKLLADEKIVVRERIEG